MCDSACVWGISSVSSLSPCQQFLNTHCVQRVLCKLMPAYFLHLCEQCDCISLAFVGVLYHDRLFYLSHHIVSLACSVEFSAKPEDKDGNSLAFQFLSGAIVTVLASKTSREFDNNSTACGWGFPPIQDTGLP